MARIAILVTETASAEVLALADRFRVDGDTVTMLNARRVWAADLVAFDRIVVATAKHDSPNAEALCLAACVKFDLAFPTDPSSLPVKRRRRGNA